MTVLPLREGAALLGLSEDTLRRWAGAGRFVMATTPAGRQGINAKDLARLAVELAPERQDAERSASARNQLPGIVTGVVRDTVMAQVDMQCGPHRVVALISREAADELDLQPGTLATASIKATSVSVSPTPAAMSR